ncbi:hypothetical protein Gohar_019688 [Gossypium harknessii]|uniref:Uncharacterized protein n=1 Tax=Gossypium harknessii TaxID=34285 RepID=A0A7J9ICM2_9ROSI|nr:hypothetical protein [Gossypium harknessii]
MLSITKDKKTADISSIHAPMEEDVPFFFPLRLVNLRSPQGIHEPVHVAS